MIPAADHLKIVCRERRGNTPRFAKALSKPVLGDQPKALLIPRRANLFNERSKVDKGRTAVQVNALFHLAKDKLPPVHTWGRAALFPVCCMQVTRL